MDCGKSATCTSDKEGEEEEEKESSSKKCFICYKQNSMDSSSSLPTKLKSCHQWSSSVSFSKQLDVVFIMKHILELPSEQMAFYLKHFPNSMEHWVDICLNCRLHHVDTCIRIFLELLEVKRRFRTARFRLIETIKKSVELEASTSPLLSPQADAEAEERKKEDYSHGIRKLYNICKEIRRFAQQHYYHYIDSGPLNNSGFVETTTTATSQVTTITHNVFSCPEENGKDRNRSPQHSSQDINNEVKEEIVTSESSAESSQFENAPCNEDHLLTDQFLKDNKEEKLLKECHNSGVAFTDGDKQDSYDGCHDDDWNGSSISAGESPDDESKLGKNELSAMLKRKQFKCDQCPDIYRTEKSLRLHKIRQHRANRDTCTNCDICDYKTTSEVRLINHKKRHHANDKDRHELTCSTCQKIMSCKSALRLHKLQHHSHSKERKIFQCQNCDKKFTTNRYLIHHMCYSHGIRPHYQERKSFQCEHCDKVCMSKTSLLNHLGLQHGIKDNLKFHCSKEGCSKSFVKRSLWKQHEREKHTDQHYECTICGKSLRSSSGFLRHLKQHRLDGKKPFKCDVCPASFARKDNMKTHMAAHDSSNLKSANLKAGKRKRGWCERKSFKCSECGLIFGFKKFAQEHIEKMHAGLTVQVENLPQTANQICELEKKNKERISKRNDIQCEHCGEYFFTSDAYYNHLGSKHKIKDHLKFHCVFEGCDKSFYRKHQLKSHQLSHYPSQWQWKCDTCGKSFISKQNLSTHVAIRHEDAKPFLCHLCPASFPLKQYLNMHLKYKHERKYQIRCELCGKTLSSPKSLKIHKRVHMVKKSSVHLFLCTVEGCTKSYKSRNRLKAHIISFHEGLRPFKCDICGKNLVSCESRQRHIKAMHTNQESNPSTLINAVGNF